MDSLTNALKQFGPGVLTRAVAWVLTAWLGLSAVQASSLGGTMAEAAVALAVAVLTLLHDVHGRRKLKAQPGAPMSNPAAGS